jgi:hypothetical protein
MDLSYTALKTFQHGHFSYHKERREWCRQVEVAAHDSEDSEMQERNFRTKEGLQ